MVGLTPLFGQLPLLPMNTPIPENFYVVAHERGAENPSLPTWANRGDNPLSLAESYPVERIRRIDIDAVPGAYQLLNVLAPEECERFIALSEALGYLEDAAVSLPREVRHNDNVVWVTDRETDGIVWQRVADAVSQHLELFDGRLPLGINARFRFYRYSRGDYFRAHTDGAWPGSRVINGELVANAYPDRYSAMTFLILLNDQFEGGATRFFVPEGSGEGGGSGRMVDIRTPAGGVLCFPHGMHPMHCVHSSEPIFEGVKYIIRTDLLFEL